jgi:hypothetical protein
MDQNLPAFLLFVNLFLHDLCNDYGNISDKITSRKGIVFNNKMGMIGKQASVVQRDVM